MIGIKFLERISRNILGLLGPATNTEGDKLHERSSYISSIRYHDHRNSIYTRIYNQGLQNPDRRIVQRKVTPNTTHAACGHGEGGENTNPERGAPKDTETFDNRAPPISQVVLNLVSKRSSDYALRVAPGREEARAGLGLEITRLGQLSLGSTTGSRGGEGEDVHGRLEPLTLGSFLRKEGRFPDSKTRKWSRSLNNGLI